MATKRGNGIFYMDRRLKMGGRINRSLETDDRRTADYRENLILRLDSRGQWDILDAYRSGAFGAAALAEAIEKGPEAVRSLVEYRGDVKVADLIDQFVKDKSTEIKTAERYGKSLKTLVAWRPTVRVSQLVMGDVINEYKRYRLTAGLSGDSVNRDLAAISQFLKWRVGNGMTTKALENVQWAKTTKRRTRRLTKEEIVKLVSAPKHGDFYRFMLATGLRPSEALRVRGEDVDTTTLVLKVKDSKTEAGIREIPITRGMAELLTRNGAGSAFQLEYHTVSTFFRKYCKRAGIENVKLRDLRRTHLQYCRLGEKDIVKARDQAGHTTVVHTEAYLGESHVEERRNMVETAIKEMGL